MLRKIPSAALAIIIALGLSSALLAAHAETHEHAVIKISNVNLTSHAEVADLYAEIVITASSMCEELDAFGIVTRMHKSWSNRICTRNSVQQTIRNADIPVLTKMHKSLPRKVRYSANAVRKIQLAANTAQ